MAKKINVKLILELRSAGMGRNAIAASRHISKNSVGDVFHMISLAEMTVPLRRRSWIASSMIHIRSTSSRQILRITDPCGKCTGWIQH